MAGRILITMTLGLLIAGGLFPEHQRVGVERREQNSLTLSAAFSATLDSTDTIEEIGGSIDAGVHLLVQRVFSLSCGFPVVFSLPLRIASPLPPRITPGDPSVRISLIVRPADIKWSLFAGYSYPLGVWQTEEAMMKKISGGSGYHRISAGTTAALMRDPVIIAASCVYELGIPVQEREEHGIRPADITMELRVTEVLNSSFALSLQGSGTVSFPNTAITAPEKETIGTGISIGVSFLWNSKPWHMRQGLRKRISEPYSQPAYFMEGGYTFEW